MGEDGHRLVSLRDRRPHPFAEGHDLRDSALQDWLSRPGGVVDQLRSMRARSGLRGREIADALGWPQSKVPKLENARQLPSTEDVQGWARVCGVPDEADAVVALLDTLPGLRLEWQRRAEEGDALERELDELVDQATDIRCLAASAVPELLQTAGYAGHVTRAQYDLAGLDLDVVEQVVAERLQLQQTVYASTNDRRRFQFLIAEPVLHWPAAPPEVMRAQLDRLLSVVGLANVELRILPTDGGLVPLTPFAMYDDQVVMESFGEVLHLPTGAADPHRRAFDRLWSSAVGPDETRRLILHASDLLAASAR
jgi:transcriptional regulator with XRE-family HTH domain